MVVGLSAPASVPTEKDEKNMDVEMWVITWYDVASTGGCVPGGPLLIHVPL